MLWNADLGNGRYKNPILYTDYSDPDAIRVGQDYYMTASTFTNVPGLPILHSKDLVNWELLGYALKKIPEFRYRDPIHGCGVWAPALRYHDGWYYIYFPMPDEGIYMIKSRKAAGNWSEPVKVYDGAGFIDPCPFWDEDGKAYLVNGVAKSRIGYKSVLYMSEMSPDGTRLVSEPVKIYDGTPDGNITTEGPKLYKKYGYYYIFAPAGGVKTGWQIVLRSKEIFGPYEVRTVMHQGNTGINGPHQGAWVDTPEGTHWFLHFQDVFAAGRIVHLQPMQWTPDFWPIIGRISEKNALIGEPVEEWDMPVKTAKRKEAEPQKEQALPLTDITGKLLPGWQWNANPDHTWMQPAENGGIYLTAVQVSEKRPLPDYPNLLLRKWEAPAFQMEALMDLSEMADGASAGIMAMGMQYAGLALEKEEEGCRISRIRGKQVFDAGLVYADENKESVQIIKDLALKVRLVLEVIPTNDVTATSPKPEYTEGEEAKVLHPEALVRIWMKDMSGNELIRVEVPAVAGRWVGAKYGFFHVKTGLAKRWQGTQTEEIGCVRITDVKIR
ncbi:MAG: family 43 glycosylhydrolase [Lachnospiraceae bacterium]|nr:family 43 glycosylhydrolase [Lachnospiraceae bacterium]